MANTVIGSSITIDGEISGDEDLVIQGTVKGKISLKESLFVEGSGVVADGRIGIGMFVAESMLAKHDENYVPRELKDIDMSAAAKTKDSLVP